MSEVTEDEQNKWQNLYEAALKYLQLINGEISDADLQETDRRLIRESGIDQVQAQPGEDRKAVVQRMVEIAKGHLEGNNPYWIQINRDHRRREQEEANQAAERLDKPPINLIDAFGCGLSYEGPSEEWIPHELRKYRYVVGDIVTKGGLSELRTAWDQQRKQVVMTKTMSNLEMKERIESEAIITAQVDRHPNVVRAYDLVEDQQRGLIFIMEYFDPHVFQQWDGQDFYLKDYLTSKLQNSQIERSRIIREYLERQHRILRNVSRIVDDLYYQYGVLNQDIKPANILTDKEGNQVRLIDFGTASYYQEEGLLDEVGGTPDYMAPEIACGYPSSLNSEVYCLGISLYRAISGGGLPFEGKDVETIALNKITMKPKPFSREDSLMEEIPHLDQIEQVIFRAIDRDPEKRFRTASHLAEAFRAAVDGIYNREEFAYGYERKESKRNRAQEIRDEYDIPGSVPDELLVEAGSCVLATSRDSYWSSVPLNWKRVLEVRDPKAPVVFEGGDHSIAIQKAAEFGIPADIPPRKLGLAVKLVKDQFTPPSEGAWERFRNRYGYYASLLSMNGNAKDPQAVELVRSYGPEFQRAKYCIPKDDISDRFLPFAVDFIKAWGSRVQRWYDLAFNYQNMFRQDQPGWIPCLEPQYRDATVLDLRNLYNIGQEVPSHMVGGAVSYMLHDAHVQRWDDVRDRRVKQAFEQEVVTLTGVTYASLPVKNIERPLYLGS